jgi:hypothetical protein
LRTLVGVSDGDRLDVTLDQGRLIVTPDRPVIREPEKKNRKRLLKKFAAALEDLRQDAERKGANKMPLRQINAEIAASRRERRQKEALKQPVK